MYKNRVFLFTIFIVLCSLSAAKWTYADQQTFVEATLKNDFTIELNGTKEGTLYKDNSFLFTTDSQQDYYIQWRDQTVQIPSDLIQLTSNDNTADALNSNSDTNFLYASEPVSIYSGSNVAIGSMEADIKYPILEETDSTYKILLGNRQAFVNKSDTVHSEANTDQTANAAPNNSLGSQQSPASQQQGAPTDVNKIQPAAATPSSIKTTSVSGTAAASVVRAFTAQDKFFMVTEDNLGVYDNSSGSLVKVGELTKGQVYPRIADYGNWHQIKWGNGYGYVYKASTQPVDKPSIPNLNSGLKNSGLSVKGLEDMTVYDNSTGNLVPFGEINANLLYPVLSDYGNWYKIDFLGRIGYIYKPLTTRPFQPSDHYFTVLKDDLTVYDNSSGSLVAVGSLVKGQSYPRVSDYGNWHKIRFGNGYGYVYAADTTPSNGSEIKNIDKSNSSTSNSFITLTDLQVFDNSTGTLIPFATLPMNTKYPILGDNGNWYKVDVSGRVGYVYKPSTKIPFKSSDRFFKVVSPDVKIYTNDTGSLVEVGSLVEGQVYPRVSDYGNWHQIQFGNKYGYVWAASTVPDDGKTLKNINTSSNYGSKQFYTANSVEVFDNSTGSLVPFATLDADSAYPYVSLYGTNWLTVDISGRTGYVYKGSVNMGLTVTAPTLKVYGTYDQLSNSSQQASNTYLNYGDQVEVLASNNYADQIRTLDGKTTGWIQKDYLAINPTDIWWFVKNGRTLRASYSSQSSQIGTIPDQTAVHVLDYNVGNDPDPGITGWYKVQTTDGQVGWIWGNSVNGSDIIQYEKEKMGAATNDVTIFTPLNTLSTVTADQLNQYINYVTTNNTAGYLYNMGSAFIQAQTQTGVNAIYLLAHAALETGYGTSNIVQGKYNYYGIGAFDACPNQCASTFSGETAGIIDGAQWISDHYINNASYQQFTLDNMRNNFNAHQYATDDAWDEKIASIAQSIWKYISAL